MLPGRIAKQGVVTAAVTYGNYLAAITSAMLLNAAAVILTALLMLAALLI